MYNNYIELINQYKSDNTILPRWKVFEYLVALELNMLRWDDVTEVVQKYSQLPPTMKGDRGTDLVSSDLSRSAQVKSGKQVGGIGYKDICTYVANSVRILDCNHLTLVIEEGVVVNKTALIYMDEVIQYNFEQLLNKVPNESVGVIINPYMSANKLNVVQKIDELYDFISLGEMPNESTMFSNGLSKMRSFMYSYKRLRKFNIPLYDKLYSLDKIKKYYGDIYKFDDEQYQFDNMLEYYSTNGVEVLQLNMWKECKRNKMLHKSSIMSKLSDVKEMEVDYEMYIKENCPDDYKLVRTVNGLLMLTNNWPDTGSITSLLGYSLWVDCKTNKLTNLWPYTKLARVYPFNKDV